MIGFGGASAKYPLAVLADLANDGLDERLLLGSKKDGVGCHAPLLGRLGIRVGLDERLVRAVLFSIDGGTRPAVQASSIGSEGDVPRCASPVQNVHQQIG